MHGLDINTASEAELMRLQIAADRKAERKKYRFYLIPFEEIQLGTEPQYLVKGLIPRIGLTVVWGPPKSGKSFWTFDMAMHVALGRAYRGRRVQQGPVVYCCFEGQSGISARVEAFRQTNAIDEQPVPFYLEPVTIDLVADHAELIATIKRDAIRPALVVLDTLNRSLRGSENDSKDMSAYVRAADAIRETFNCAVIIVHHCGIDGDRPRGHTSLTGAVEAQLSVKRDASDTIIVEVEFAKDFAQGDVVASRLKPVNVGVDRDGEGISSCVVVPEAAPAMTASNPRISPNIETMYGLLKDSEPNGFNTEEWNDAARKEGLGIRRRADLNDFRRVLRDKKLVREYADRWHVVTT